VRRVVTTPQSASGRWISPGEPAAVGGHVIPGGLFHLGGYLTGESGVVEPALINPGLPVAPSPGRYVVPGRGPELAYHLLSPVARKAYLDWLAGGRRGNVPPGLVLLFCFGLERRVLLDGDDDPAVLREMPALTAEVRRLRARYGAGATAVRDTLDHLLDLLDLLTAPLRAPAASPDRESPTAVRTGLARFAVTSTPVPAGWARAWLRCHPSIAPRPSETDCPAEFDRLFTLRYRDRFGPGMIPPSDGAGIRLRYRPANPGLATTLVCRADLPDLLAGPGGIRPLVTLRDEVATALDPYRRWLVRYPQGRDSLAAVPMLPTDLVDARHGRLGAVRVWAERRLDGRPRALIDAGEFWEFWSAATPERMAADEAAALLAVLARLGLGVEPDVRFGAAALAPGPAVLFRLGRPAADRPGPSFPSAAAIARCAAAVASSAGPVSPHDRAPFSSHDQAMAALLATTADLAAALRLDPGEDLRLAARLGWLLTTRVDIDRLGRQTTMMTAAEREIAGHYLVTVAVTADPVVGPATVAALTRIYRILGLQPELVFQRLHERSTTGLPAALPRVAGPPIPEPVAEPAGAGRADDLVVVQPGGNHPNGYALPWATPAVPPFAGVQLDAALVRRRETESGAAATLLGAIFDAEPQEGPEPAAEPSAEPSVAGLDQAHGALLRALAARPSWTREEFVSLATAHGVLPDGALDLLNEVAIDTAGAPVIEGDATLSVTDDILTELLA
jgi:hypothetical protein